MYRPLCLCALIPSFELSTRLLVLMHCREVKLSTNTARLACLAMPNSEIRIRGERGESLTAESLFPENTHAALLFPTEDAIELNAETVKSLPRPLTLVIPDGSWRQAKKVSSREPALNGVLRLKLPPGPPSDYRLRYSPHEENLSTFEAIARAIGVLEGIEIQRKLEELFLIMVERRLWSRGKLLAKDCFTGIPEEAFVAARLAGSAGGKKSSRF
jgi:DTW domain-containing protein YfiP